MRASGSIRLCVLPLPACHCISFSNTFVYTPSISHRQTTLLACVGVLHRCVVGAVARGPPPPSIFSACMRDTLQATRNRKAR